VKRSNYRVLFSFLAAFLAAFPAAPAGAQEAGKESAAKEWANEDANNPPAKIQAFNVHDYYVPSPTEGGDETAPALPLFVRMAHADMSLAAAIMPLAVVSTVALMPLLAPLLIPGLTVSSWALAKPLLLTVLLPLVIGIAVRVYAARMADKLFRVFKRVSGISTLLLLVFVIVMYGRELLSALGSYAVASQVLYILATGMLSSTFGFGLNQAQRSAMALGICSRNGGAMFVAITAFPTLDPRLLAMILLAVPVPVVTWVVVAKFLAFRAGRTVSEAPA
jgi:predicted Na+-dependent transporter